MGKPWVGIALGIASCLVCAGARGQESEESREPAASGRFEMGLHARLVRASARSEQAAWLTLAMPLDALAQPRAVPAAVAPPEAVVDAPAASRAPSLGLAALRELSTFAQQTKAVALGVAGAASARRRLDALATRARVSAALPELRVRAQRDTDQALRWAPTTDDPYRVTQADGAGTTLEASLTFQLDRLLFSRDELAVERLREGAAAERAKLEARVLAALWGLFRARELGCAAGIEDDERAEQLSRLAEHFGSLDDLTAGWFSAHAEALAARVWGFPEAISGVCAPPPPPSARALSPTNAVASLEDSE